MDVYSADRTKYDVPLSHLDHRYIETCSDHKELEKIIKVLRGGYEGSYPDMEELAEKRLQLLRPDSKVLRKEKPVSTKRDLTKEELNDMESDLSSWEAEMRNHDSHLQEIADLTANDHRLPPVRGAATNIPINQKAAEEMERKQRRVKPRDYDEWDKVDVEAELAKVDGEKPKPKKNNIQNKMDIPAGLETKDLTDAEKTIKANREKDKGNEAFRSGDYEEALVYYKRSLSVSPTTAVHNNRAQTYLKMQKWSEALNDCNKVLSQEPSNLKALLRRAISYQGSRDYIKSKTDLSNVLHHEPNNKRALQVLEEVEKCLVDQKVKGRRMVIEEVDGSDSSDDENTSINEKTPINENTAINRNTASNENTAINGHATKEQIVDHDQTQTCYSKVKPIISEVHSRNADQCNNSSRENSVDEKDIWTEEELNKKPSFTGSIPVTRTQSSKHEATVAGGTSEVQGGTNKVQGGTSEFKKETNKLPEGNNELNVSRDDAQNSSGTLTDKSVTSENLSAPLPQESAHPENLSAPSLPQESANPENLSAPSLPQESANPENLSAPLPEVCAALKDKGNQLFKKGQYPEASDLYDKVIHKLLADGASQSYNLSLVYCNRAATRQKMGDSTGCIDDCNKALEIQPIGIKALARRAMAYETMEKYRLAYVDFRQVLLLDSSVEIAQQGSTRCTKHLRDQDGPRWREKLPTTTPIVAPSLSLLQNQTRPNVGNTPDKPINKEKQFEKYKTDGNNCVKKGDYTAAVGCYTKCIDCCPGSVVAYTNRALCYLKTKQPECVIKDCDVALGVEPDNVKALFRRALAYKVVQRYGDSVDDLKHLIKVDSKNSAARKEFAAVLREKQEYEMKCKQESLKKPRKKIEIQEVDGSDSSDSSDDDQVSPRQDTSRTSRQSRSNSGDARHKDHVQNVLRHQVPEHNISEHKIPEHKDTKHKIPEHKDTKHKITEHKDTKHKIPEHKVDATTKTHTETFSLPVAGQKRRKSSKTVTESPKAPTTTASPTEGAAVDDITNGTTTCSSSETSEENRTGDVKRTVPFLSKATPYEFMHVWSNLKSKDFRLYAELLTQVPPRDLKTLISNKLEGEMLMIITKCVQIISDQGHPEKALQYLINLPKVPRFSMVAMFMSNNDKKEVSGVVGHLRSSLGSRFTPDQFDYIKKQYQL